ncbi:unnamed protein product, partial [Mesorhabditis spiculigera]
MSHRQVQLAFNEDHPSSKYFSKEPSEDSLIAFPYSQFDVVIPDINEKELKEMGVAVDCENLSPGSFSSTPFPVTGQIHGRNLRLMAPLVCQHCVRPNRPVLHVWFLIDTGSPFTTLTVKTLERLIGPGFTNHQYDVYIQDREKKIRCHISRAHFSEVNVLGMDAIMKLKLTIKFDWKVSDDTFDLFGGILGMRTIISKEWHSVNRIAIPQDTTILYYQPNKATIQFDRKSPRHIVVGQN